MRPIPRMFHRIWLGDAPMPEEFRAFGDTWLKHHPGWTLHTWTDDDAAAMAGANRQALRRSAALSGKANVLRYEILLRCGGVYVDTDFECLRNIEPLLAGVSCFVGLQSDRVANNAILGAVPGHPFLRDLVDHIPARSKGFARLASIKQSGPYYLTDRLRGRRDVTVFAPDVFYPYQWHERWRRHESFPDAYAVHHWALSWRQPVRRQPAGPASATAVVVNASPDLTRVRWTMEGLCEQRGAGARAVVLLDYACSPAVEALARGYADRLRVRYVAAPRTPHGWLDPTAWRRCLEWCDAPRVIVLDSHCVPDADVWEVHSAWAGRPVVVFGPHRVYPAAKVYPYVPPVDYDSFRIHARPDPRAEPMDAAAPHFTCCCLSCDPATFGEFLHAADHLLRSDARWLAGELSARRRDMVVLTRDASVTWLAT